MKTIYPVTLSIAICLLLSIYSSAQETIEGTLMHDDIERSFILYVPESYDPTAAPVPLVFNFHGYTSSAVEQLWYGDFQPVADTANFLVVHPQGELLNGITHWNVGGWTLESEIDDIGFTDALLDLLIENYNIDEKRVYSTGMSNGGYMSFLLACQLSDRIAAVASVTGSMTPQTFDACDPQRAVPVLQIHGTNDGVVPYNGDFWTLSIDAVMEYWINHNACTEEAAVSDFPNISEVDNSTVSHFVYECEESMVSTEHMKVHGGGHTWPGAFFASANTNYDIDASTEIWRFFSRYNLDGLISSTSALANDQTRAFPNPVDQILFVEGVSRGERVELIGLNGELLRTLIATNDIMEMDVSDLIDGMYFLRFGNQARKIMKLK